MDSFQSCRFFDQFWIKVFCLSDKSCIGVTVLMIVHFLKFDSPIWNFEFIWNMCICKRIYVSVRYDTFIERSCEQLNIARRQQMNVEITAKIKRLICCGGHYPSTTRRTTFNYIDWTYHFS